MSRVLLFPLLGLLLGSPLFRASHASAASPSCAAGHPAVAILKAYGLADGDTAFVNPYIVSLLSIHALQEGRLIDEVRGFIDWYFAKLNYPDEHGLTGTIYDYEVGPASETHAKARDSVDGYAGIFLVLLDVYRERTGDVSVLAENGPRVRDIAYLIAFLQDEDGLTKAGPENGTKYMMNNCEAYAGIRAYGRMRRWLGAEAEDRSEVERTLKTAIVERFRDPSGGSENGDFIWAIAGEERHASSLSILYPDALAQVFPVLHGLLDDAPALEARTWGRFMKAQGDRTAAFPVEQRVVIDLTRRAMSAKTRDVLKEPRRGR